MQQAPPRAAGRGERVLPAQNPFTKASGWNLFLQINSVSWSSPESPAGDRQTSTPSGVHVPRIGMDFISDIFTAEIG